MDMYIIRISNIYCYFAVAKIIIKSHDKKIRKIRKITVYTTILKKNLEIILLLVMKNFEYRGKKMS